jgi:serralysin
LPIATGALFRSGNAPHPDSGPGSGSLIDTPRHRPFGSDSGLLDLSDPATAPPIWFGEVGAPAGAPPPFVLGGSGTGLTGQDPMVLGQAALGQAALGQAGIGSVPLGTTLQASELTLVTYVSGIDNNGSLADTNTDPSFASWDGSTSSPSYSGSNGVAHQWTAAVAGLAPTVDVYFDPASNWSAAEVTAFKQGMALWSDVANIVFQYVTSSSLATYTISRATAGSGVAETFPNYNYGIAGGSSGTSTSYKEGVMYSASTEIDTGTYGWQSLDSYSTVQGYGPETVVHEEGHMLGLGHDGPYNGAAINQNGSYDTRQYSIMSYFNSSNQTVNGTQYYPTTPMFIDIAAAQRLYGAPTNSALSGGQVFGFNTNTGLQAYDFTLNTRPVVTIYDTGTRNTLDLSGFSNSATIDLRPGYFSSAAGMIDNIGIYPGVAVDTAIGTKGGTTFWVNGDSDMLVGQGLGNVAVFTQPKSAYTIAVVNSATTTVSQGTTVDTLVDIQNMVFNACYAPFTLIATPDGQAEAGSLRAGDVVRTLAGEVARVRWVGRRHVDADVFAEDPSRRPIRIAPGALGPNCPRRPLVVSPLHALWLDGVLVPAELLVNGGTIRRLAPRGGFDYVHVELDRHDILLAEGAAAESFIDLESRWMFENAADAPAGGPREECGRRIGADDLALARIRARLAPARAGKSGRWTGHLDRAGPDLMIGWAMNEANPLEPALLRVEAAGNEAPPVLLASSFREDLAAAGMGDGCLGFYLKRSGGRAPRLYLPDGALLAA